MILIPLRHDRMTVRRLPWVSFGILFLNVLVFVGFTRPARHRFEERMGRATAETLSFRFSHPHVQFSEAFAEEFPALADPLRKAPSSGPEAKETGDAALKKALAELIASLGGKPQEVTPEQIAKIKFFYFLVWPVPLLIRSGTFSAPAWLMLPLWLVEQLWYAGLSSSSSGTAFSAHAAALDGWATSIPISTDSFAR